MLNHNKHQYSTKPLIKLELADIFRNHSQDYIKNYRLCTQQYKAIRSIIDCRTAKLGGHLFRCDGCNYEKISYNSCRNRHCPKCQSVQKERWISARQAELLPVAYFHVVFTLPHTLNPLIQGRPAVMYNMLFQAASETLLNLSLNKKWLGAKPGITMVLHTWGQNINQHVHVHCIISGGGLTKKNIWKNCKKNFLFPIRALSKIFRSKYIDKLKLSLNNKDVNLPAGYTNTATINKFISSLFKSNWVVYAKAPFAGPKQVLSYLGRYTHKIAISNQRLVNLQNNKVSFKWRDYADNNKSKIMNLNVNEFIRRYLLHVLPKGFQRLRHYGILANRFKKDNLKKARQALNQLQDIEIIKENIDELMLRITGEDIAICPRCHIGRLKLVMSLIPKWLIHSGDPPVRSTV